MSLRVDGVTSSSAVEINPVTPGYFDTIGMVVRRGRAFTREDRQGGPRVAVMNESGLLFGLTPTDPITIALAALALFAVATMAAYLPAWRVSRLDPTKALRCE